MTERATQNQNYQLPIEGNLKNEVHTGKANVRHSYSKTQDLGWVYVNGQREVLGEKQKTIIVPAPWSDYSSRPMQQDRLAAIAEAAGVSVLGIDFPGQGPDSTGLPRERAGSGGHPSAAELFECRGFSVIGELGWEAIQKALPNSYENREFILFGASQGAATVAGMLHSKPREMTVSDAVLLEHPGFEKRSVGKLATTFFTNGAKDMKYYAKLNKDSAPWAAPDDPGRLAKLLFSRKARQAHLAPIRVMAKGLGLEDLRRNYLGESRYNDTARIHLFNSAQSKVSTTASNEKVAQILKTDRDIHHEVLHGEYHGVQNVFTLMGAIARRVVTATA